MIMRLQHFSGRSSSLRSPTVMGFKVGIMGGTGLEATKVFDNPREVHVDTPYGVPSDTLLEGEVGGVTCVLMSRHGRNHDKSPSDINYRANLWAMMKQGVSVIIATAASGSLKEEVAPGTLVIVDSFIDRTFKRDVTFHDGKEGHPKGVLHIPSHPSFHPRLREVLISCAEELNIKHFKTGTVICIEGPRYSSKAESAVFRSWHADTINMTVCPEVYLAKELGIPYASIGLVTDYDCWHEAEQVSVELVAERMTQNATKAKDIMLAAIKKLGSSDWAADLREAKATARAGVMIDKGVVIPHLEGGSY